MSVQADVNPPVCAPSAEGDVALVVEGRARDLGGFSVRRLLPSPQRRHVGPFVFFDHMGPAQLAPGTGMDVRPHPHIALATLTFLFDGVIMHRDSLGSEQPVRPGDVNWMVAGRGITHSERSPVEARPEGPRIHGIQTWLALPIAQEEAEPRFEHHPAATIPRVLLPGATLDVIAGSAFGHSSPVGVFSRTLYVHGVLEAGTELTLDTEHRERAVYVVEGSVRCGGACFSAGSLFVLREDRAVQLHAEGASRVMIFGGEPLDGERFMFWNFVSSSHERLELAKADWKAGRFPKVPGDAVEFIPLPE